MLSRLQLQLLLQLLTVLLCQRYQRVAAATTLHVLYKELTVAADQAPAYGGEGAHHGRGQGWRRQLAQRSPSGLPLAGNLTLGYYQAEVAIVRTCLLHAWAAAVVHGMWLTAAQ